MWKRLNFFAVKNKFKISEKKFTKIHKISWTPKWLTLHSIQFMNSMTKIASTKNWGEDSRKWRSCLKISQEVMGMWKLITRVKTKKSVIQRKYKWDKTQSHQKTAPITRSTINNKDAHPTIIKSNKTTKIHPKIKKSSGPVV